MRDKAKRVVKFSALDSRIKSGKADPVSDAQRASAARIRVSVDKRRGRDTEPWIKDLAKG
ncbi:hypothetical protein J2W54_004995 [Rhodococcus fascians]|uniref:hypothetical protein n=1 Tax=Nocardiaceae TaxID=85025 RepID=UPI00286644C9|nr:MULTISPECIES: hypothetical protein [Rhodococcus]MDR6912982.1 hypothetical protein [Rhodococcus sp. 3258]MDR6934579.1 hypothetical protein [Rhodococcus fascians]